MKNTFKAYSSFTRKERIGIIVLLGVLVLLLIMRATMSLWVKPTTDNAQQEKITKAWENYKNKHTTHKQGQPVTEPLPDIININTADSATLIRMKGIGPVNARNILAYRRNYGNFTDLEQIRAICTFKGTTFNELKGHISVTPVSE